MNSELLPFKPINRSSSKKSLTGCVPSTPGCILVGSLLVFLGVLIIGGAGLTAYFLVQPKVMAAPTVEITSPANNSEVIPNTPLQVWATVFAPEGITRLELWQSGQQISGLAITNDQDLSELNVSFQWVPPAPGKFTLEVKAYGRSNDLGALAAVTVNVVDNRPSQPETSTGKTMLTAKTDLIVRDGPGETFTPLGTLPAGVSVAGLEQSADQQWWRIAFGSTDEAGWIPADAESVSVSNGDDLSVTSTATITPTLEPTATETPTLTPEPTATPVPTNTPAPPQDGGMPDEGGPGGQPGSGGPGPGGQLPDEAITACSSLSEGSSCTSSGPTGIMTGTCVTLEEQLVCMPEGGPPGRP